MDVELLQNIHLHPRVCHISIQLDSDTTLGNFVPLKELEKCKQLILVKYDQLVSATLEQKNKVTYLYQQTSNMSTQRASSEIVIQRVQKMKNQVNRFIDLILDIQKKIHQELKTRRRIKKKGSLYLNLNTPPSTPRFLDRSQQSNRSQNILIDAMRSLYSHETFIHLAEKLVIDEKQSSLASFIHCMQSISQVEESVTKIYPRLADLEKDIKLLRQEIEKGKGATARRVITGYVREPHILIYIVFTIL